MLRPYEEWLRGIRTIEPGGSGEGWLGGGWFGRGFEDGVDFSAGGSERADGVGGGGVAGQEESLAAAAAEILFAAVACFARFLHPGFAAKFLEGCGIFPDFA
jgi:hypothetical protein